MHKKVLIISPYFPPSNAADMHRVRASLPYFEQYGWKATVVAVSEEHSEMVKDKFLTGSIPANLEIYRVKAFSKNWTSKFGLGSIALRSIWFYSKCVNKLLKSKKFDLIYFSTTQFPVMVLGHYWKSKFNIPYVIDLQDPWHSDYYHNKEKHHRPPKYWFSYLLNKYLEPMAMHSVDGLLVVSAGYLRTLKQRYSRLNAVASRTLPFSANELDFEIAYRERSELQLTYPSNDDLIHLVYVGRAGDDMQSSLKLLFETFKEGLTTHSEHFEQLRFHFIGTSYAKSGFGIKTVEPIATVYQLEKYVDEQTNRIGYYHTLNHLLHADGIILPGSDDPDYTASKIFPCIIANRPLLAIFNGNSSVKEILEKCGAGIFADMKFPSQAKTDIHDFLLNLKSQAATRPENLKALATVYTAEHMTEAQCELFDQVLHAGN